MRERPNAIKQDKGFTLVELLVVIIIIGILAAVAIPAFLNQRQRANDAAVQSDIKNISTSIETLLAENPQGPIYRSSDSKKVVSGTSSESVAISNGVSWDMYGSATGYCVQAWHSNGKQFKLSSPLYFDSAAGGLSAVNDPCGTVPASPNGTAISGSGGASEPTVYAWTGTPNASISTSTGQSGVIRRNLILNPSFENGITGWAGYSGTIASVTSPKATSGTKVARFTATSVVNGAGFYNGPDSTLPSVTPGKTYRFGFVITVPTGSTTSIPYVTFLTSTGTWAGDGGGTVSALPGKTTVFNFTAVAPVGATRVRIDPRTSGSPKIGDTFDIDSVIVEESNIDAPYFDGSTTSTFQ